MTEDLLHGLDFGATMRDVTKGLLVKPVMHNYLYDATFPDFEVKFRNHRMEREPDGWFHPSTHPLWKPGALFRYLTQPKAMPVERKQYMNTLSVTMGTAVHGFFQTCMEDAGIRPFALNKCPVCPKTCPAPKGRGKVKICGCAFDEGPLKPGNEHFVGCPEPGAIDVETGSRGHLDGILDLSRMSTPSEAYDQPGFEFKTSSARTPLDDLDLETYRKRHPIYYAQNQEYMRLRGLRMMIVVFMSMGFPWDLTEIHVPYDPAFAATIKNKYLAVRQAVADQTEVSCCSLKGCPAYGLCRVEQARAAVLAAAQSPRLAL